MPKLNNIKHEQFSQNTIKKGSLKEAYQSTYPNASEETSQVNSSQLMKREDVRARVYELLQESNKTKIETVVENIGDLSKANKVIVLGKEIREVQDNPTRMDANKTLLKLYGLDQTGPQVDNRSVHLNITSSDTKILENIATTLQDMNKTLKMDNDLQDGEIIDIKGDMESGVGGGP